MYQEFYSLTANPFQLTPDPAYYFGGRSHSKAMAYLTFGLDQGEGFIIVTGEVGAGKTTVVGSLIDELSRDKYLISNVVTPHGDPDMALRLVAAGFGIDTEGRDSAAVIGSIHDALKAAHQDGRRVILIVDEAQNLSDASLEQLRMLLNFQSGNQALMQIVLVGQPEFRSRLAEAAGYEQVRQRVIAACHLLPLANAAETRHYLDHRLSVAGYEGDPIFSDEAIEEIHEFSGGVPRRINQLASRLLLHGFLAEQHSIDQDAVKNVCSEMLNEWDPTPLKQPVSLAWDKDGTRQ
ncbi:MAG: ExeA family protein [Alphaproteobacteria bacterium]